MLVKRNKMKQIGEVIDKLRKQNFNISTQYKFIQIAKAFEQEQEILNEQLDSLIIEYGERNEQNQLIQEAKGVKIKDEYTLECSKKIQEIKRRR